MFRYIAIAWNPQDPAQKETACRAIAKLRSFQACWKESLTTEGLVVFCAGSEMGSMNGQALGNDGIVCGMLFARGAEEDADLPRGPIYLTGAEHRKVLATHGRHLVDAYWGNYVAILQDTNRKALWIVKDPTGSLPCFYSTVLGTTVIFSCLQDVTALHLVKYSINWDYVRQRLATSGFFSDQSSLCGLQQVHRGQAIALSYSSVASREAHVYWNPLNFAEEDLVESADVACRKLSEVVRRSTFAMLSPHENVLVRVSGGLDSSIVVGCLKKLPVPRNIVTYTYYNPHGGSDERRWARLAMQNTGYEHLECPFDPTQIDLSPMLEILPTVEPAPALMYLTRRTIERWFIATYGCTGVLSGEGGDSSFGSESIGQAADEYVRRHGLGSRSVSLAAQVATVLDTSAWSVLWTALKKRYFGSSMALFTTKFLKTSKLLSPELRTLLNAQHRFAHPWFVERKDIPWETISRLGALVLTPEHYDPFLQPHETCMEHLAPLYSQPVVELCLRIPTYVHFVDGKDRGLARRAFAADVPAPILRRQWKDRAPGFAYELAHRNMGFLKDVLLGGALVREGLLDRDALEGTLSGKLNKSEAVLPELFGALDVELWIHSVAGKSSYQLAA